MLLIIYNYILLSSMYKSPKICYYYLQIVSNPTVKPTTKHVNLTTPGFIPIFSMRPAVVDTPLKNLSQSQYSYPLACDHIVTTYVVPNFLHFVAFVMGLIHFRVQENEQLYALMESVSI